MLNLDGLARSFPTQTFPKSGAYSKLQGMGREGTDGAAAVPRKGPWNSTLTISPPPLPNFNTIFSLDCINESNK